VSYGGEVAVADRWRDEFGEEIKHTDQHFRIVYLTTKPSEEDAKLTAVLKDSRIAVCRPEQLAPESREALADLLAAEEMKKNCAAPNQGSLRDYADGKRRDAIKAILKCQQDEFRRGKVVTQKGYGIQAMQILQPPKTAKKHLPVFCWTKLMTRRCSAPRN
jgi:anion-transporting  ArsA/GET3 family ATPase